MLRSEGFQPFVAKMDPASCHWGTLSVKLNDQIGPYFKSFKGVIQGDPFSPFLFNLVAESCQK
uniref:Reverse transcriptase domain-containing protein n=1 Tax=Arundo donax TaxID=35708 RepID=A0A0A8ZCV8_ARUDO